MHLKFVNNKKICWLALAVGVVSFLFGIISALFLPSEEGNINMLMGMFTGFGGGIIGVAVVNFIRIKTFSPEKLKKQEIAIKDERNVQLMRISFTISSTAATILFSLLAFIFVFLNYRIPAFISVGALYIQQICFFIAYKYFSKKM